MTTWFCACPAENPCVVTSSFEFLLNSMLQTFFPNSTNPHVSLDRHEGVRRGTKGAHLLT